jgi:hypothetical protein
MRSRAQATCPWIAMRSRAQATCPWIAMRSHAQATCPWIAMRSHAQAICRRIATRSRARAICRLTGCLAASFPDLLRNARQARLPRSAWPWSYPSHRPRIRRVEVSRLPSGIHLPTRSIWDCHPRQSRWHRRCRQRQPPFPPRQRKGQSQRRKNHHRPTNRRQFHRGPAPLPPRRPRLAPVPNLGIRCLG